MKKPPRHILPAALLISAALHLLAFGSLLVYLGAPIFSDRAGEGDSAAVHIEIGLVPAAEGVPEPPPPPEPIPRPEAPVIEESQVEPALDVPPEPVEIQDPEPEEKVPPPPEAAPAEAGRAGREEVTAGGADDEYLRRVRRRIEEATYYPRRARLSRLEGRVRVGFSIAPGGEIRRPELLEPSPHGLFNRTALDILNRSGPFPPPVPGIEGKPISVSISFESTY